MRVFLLAEQCCIYYQLLFPLTYLVFEGILYATSRYYTSLLSKTHVIITVALKLYFIVHYAFKIPSFMHMLNNIVLTIKNLYI